MQAIQNYANFFNIKLYDSMHMPGGPKFLQIKENYLYKYIETSLLNDFNQQLACFSTCLSERIVKNKQKLRKLVKIHFFALLSGKCTIKCLIKQFLNI